MIVSFRHKGLKRLYHEDDARGIRPDLLSRVRDILARLDVADDVRELAQVPGYRLHPLTGELRGLWSVTVRANWHIIFRFAKSHASDVELIDYH
jgi:proteic killer suppression protein